MTKYRTSARAVRKPKSTNGLMKIAMAVVTKGGYHSAF